MSDILFIKTSSLGDVIHQMPAVTDTRRQFPHAHIAWVVEKPFAPLVRLHPAVDRVIAVASRRWRRHLWQPKSWQEAKEFAATLRASRYDLVIDTQGLMRTGIIARIARGERHGYDAASIRERAATLAYDVRHRVDRGLHAIRRNRLLTGAALGYVPEGPVEFGLEDLRWVHAVQKPVAVLLHATARAEKQWPVGHWQALATALAERGFAVVLPSGSAAESERSEQIAAGVPDAQLLDRQPLDAVAQVMAEATLVVGVDTGLLHLGAALGVPLIALFVGGSDPALTGPTGSGPIEIVTGEAVPPAPADVLAVVEKLVPIMG